MVSVSPNFDPALIRGLTVHKDNPFLFDFIVDPGQEYPSVIARSEATKQSFKDQADRMIKYFFASLTIPDKDIWVNLSPYEKDRMVPESLGVTAMGRDLLAQDYMLKQLTASLIYPQKALGKTFWAKVYAKAKEMYGTTQVPVNTFNKVWIVPQRVGIYEHGQTAFIVDGHLKVMLEEDYLSMTKHNAIQNSPVILKNNSVILSEGPHAGHAQVASKDLNKINSIRDSSATPQNDVNTLGSQIIRQIVLPEIEKEVNDGKNFATLRQIFYAQALAVWFKRNLKQALLNRVYANKGTVKGIDQNNPATNEAIFQQYLRAYKKGVFNYIKEDIDPGTQETLPRKYFSGGYGDSALLAIIPAKLSDAAMSGIQRNDVDFAVVAATPTDAVALAKNVGKEDAAMTTDLLPEWVKNIRYSDRFLGSLERTATPQHVLNTLETLRQSLLEISTGRKPILDIEYLIKSFNLDQRLTPGNWERDIKDIRTNTIYLFSSQDRPEKGSLQWSVADVLLKRYKQSMSNGSYNVALMEKKVDTYSNIYWNTEFGQDRNMRDGYLSLAIIKHSGDIEPKELAAGLSEMAAKMEDEIIPVIINHLTDVALPADRIAEAMARNELKQEQIKTKADTLIQDLFTAKSLLQIDAVLLQLEQNRIAPDSDKKFQIIVTANEGKQQGDIRIPQELQHLYDETYTRVESSGIKVPKGEWVIKNTVLRLLPSVINLAIQGHGFDVILPKGANTAQSLIIKANEVASLVRRNAAMTVEDARLAVSLVTMMKGEYFYSDEENYPGVWNVQIEFIMERLKVSKGKAKKIGHFLHFKIDENYPAGRRYVVTLIDTNGKKALGLAKLAKKLVDKMKGKRFTTSRSGTVKTEGIDFISRELSVSKDKAKEVNNFLFFDLDLQLYKKTTAGMNRGVWRIGQPYSVLLSPTAETEIILDHVKAETNVSTEMAADKAALTNKPSWVQGGIDLSQQGSALHITKDANGGVKVDVDPALIARVEREGMLEVDPVIIGMRPADIQSLFGVGVSISAP